MVDLHGDQSAVHWCFGHWDGTLAQAQWSSVGSFGNIPWGCGGVPQNKLYIHRIVLRYVQSSYSL